uniref:Uncharacterized protein n=1 Tax=Candidatus Kentrum sp. TC TaxID=2126339 RepID=A0A450ZZ79_9GAMM|nr:MAG: hypothetical protein BECKTC1821E_GA0114239_102915 [Candidatus Kentron sp. TC]VFK59078.1 MAG: hypothetical protein BECKTC1821F_GA0114240_10298 [Candidatus Kentron sp. TC]
MCFHLFMNISNVGKIAKRVIGNTFLLTIMLVFSLR